MLGNIRDNAIKTFDETVNRIVRLSPVCFVTAAFFDRHTFNENKNLVILARVADGRLFIFRANAIMQKKKSR